MLAILDTASLDRAVLVGASYGALVALDLAASHPERVAGLVLAGAPLPDQPWSPETEAFFAAEEDALASGDLAAATELNVAFWLPDAPELVRTAIGRQQLRAFELQIGSTAEESFLTDDLPSKLGAIHCPALVLVGEHDVADFRAIADRLAAALPNAREETIAGAAHLPSLERPDAFDAVVLAFIAELAGAARVDPRPVE